MLSKIIWGKAYFIHIHYQYQFIIIQFKFIFHCSQVFLFCAILMTGRTNQTPKQEVDASTYWVYLFPWIKQLQYNINEDGLLYIHVAL